MTIRDYPSRPRPTALATAAPRRDAGWWLKETALTVGAILGVLCILFAIFGSALGIKPLVFRSGSMEPTISTGALAISRAVPASDLRVGDVVSVTDAGGNRVTHRITDIGDRSGNSASLQLRGDANRTPDTQQYVVTTADRVAVDIPLLGYLVSWLATPAALLVLALLVALLLWITFRPDRLLGSRRSNLPRHGRPPGRHAAGGATPLILAMAAVAASVITVVGSVQNTLAAFTDTATATAGFSAANLEATAPGMGCSRTFLGSTVTMRWTPSPDTSVSYAIIVKNGGNEVKRYVPTTGRSSQDIRGGDLDVGFLFASGTLTVELHTLVGGQLSRNFSAFTVPYTYAILLGTTLWCGGQAPGVAPREAPPPTPTSTAVEQPAESSAALSSDAPADTPASNTPGPDTPPATSETPVPEPPAPSDTPLSAMTSSGGYGAQVVRRAGGDVAVVITDSSGTEQAAIAGTADDRLTWNDGDLWINRSGSYYRVSRSGSEWSASPVAADQVPDGVG